MEIEVDFFVYFVERNNVTYERTLVETLNPRAIYTIVEFPLMSDVLHQL